MNKVNELNPYTLLAFKQWLAVLSREGKKETLWGKVKLLWHIGVSFLKIGGVSKARWLKRMEVCHACAVFDPSLWRCRAYDGSPAGCGCFVKYAALIRNPYGGGCWGHTVCNGSIGWPAI